MSIKPPSKIKRVIALLIKEELDFITAQQIANDRSLHSTVSEIQRDYGIDVCRRRKKHPGYLGLPTPCCGYRIFTDQHDKAYKAMERMK